MNISNNIRFRSTEEKIEQALIRLLKKRSYDNIFVKDICTEANINRSSFYAHFYDINDLMMKYEQKIAQSIIKIFKNSGFEKSTFVKMFEFIKQNKDFYNAFLKSNHIFSTLEQEMVRKLENTLYSVGKEHNISYNKTDFAYHLCFFGNGLKGICELWIKNDCKESPEYLAEIILQEYNYIS